MRDSDRVVPADNEKGEGPQKQLASDQVSYYELFEPIDLVKYKKDVLSSHSVKPIATKSVWPDIRPTPLESRQRNVKSEDHSLNKSRKRGLSKATSIQTQSCVNKSFKYHSFTMKNFQFVDEKKQERAVACQTEDLQKGCKLCNLHSLCSQPNKSLLIEMKQCQDREELERYNLRMSQRESSASGSERTQGSSSFSRDEMRRQLEECQAALTLCDQLVESQIRLSRFRAENELNPNSS